MSRRPEAEDDPQMPLLKRRPEIQLFAPTTIVMGQPVRVRAVLRCAEPVPVDSVEIELVGTGVWFTSSQYGRHRNTSSFSRWVARPLRERTELTAGEHTLSAGFEVPPDMPASYVGRRLTIEWTVRVHVDIPWWPDARATFVVFVAGQSEAPKAPPRRVFASSTEGPQGRKPYAEISLGSTVLEPGGRLQGKVALANTASNDYRALRLSLVAVETVPGLVSSWSQHDVRARYEVPLPEPREDTPIEFALRLPADLAPEFCTRTLALAWFVEARLDVAWSVDTKLWIPVTVRASRASGGEEAAAPLAVGSERLALIWAEGRAASGLQPPRRGAQLRDRRRAPGDPS